MGISDLAGKEASEGCYDHLSFVSVLRDSEIPDLVSISDVDVGDYVWDGTEFTKVCTASIVIEICMKMRQFVHERIWAKRNH